MMRARLFLRFAAVSSALSLAACLGGTGTDTENGISLRDAAGAPMAHVQVKVHSATSTPDSVGADPVVGGSANLATDAEGNLRFFLETPGKYLIEGRRGDTVLFVDTLKPARAKAQVIVARTPVRLTGRIRLLSGYRADTGLVFVRGTGLSSPVRSDGTYDLGWGPADARNLTVGLRYGASPTSRAFVKMSARESAGKVISNAQNWLQASDEPIALAPDSLTLFKAASLGKGHSTRNETCLEEDVSAVTPARTVIGSLNKPLDVVRATGIACDGQAGTLIETQSVTASGQPLAKINDFVMPDTLAWGEGVLGRGGITNQFPASQRAILADCIRAASAGVSYRTTVKAGGEIRVDDVLRGVNCLAF